MNSIYFRKVIHLLNYLCYYAAIVCTNYIFSHLALRKKWSFPLRISSVNVTKSAVSCGFGHIYWRNLSWKTSFFVQCLLLGNRISSLITEIYSYWKTRAWLYCNVFNKKCNIVILLSKWGQNFDQILLDNQTPALLMLQFTFTVQLCILVWESYVDCNILIMLFSSFL